MRPGVFQSFGPDVEPDRDGWLDVTVEGWEVRGVGRRVETRRGSKLTSVTVLTPRWQFTWDVTANVVVAHSACSYQHELAGESMPLSWLREALETHLKATAISYTVEKDRRDGKPVEKITAKYLAVPGWIGEEPTHGFDAKRDHKLAKIPGAKFLTRTYWFDPMTHVIVGYRCGCQKPKQEWWCDYPAPESVPRELFTFRVPREATLEINDPELGRQVRSEGQKGPDLRQ
jgi:hypothetical protein